MRILFDIDGTLCENTNGRYSEAKPYADMVALVNELYANGHYIIFHTARGMGKHNGNSALAYADWYCITKKQLDFWGVRYHELHLGKIEADFYVDDKAIKVDSGADSADKIRKRVLDGQK